jgi:hypothetical protein
MTKRLILGIFLAVVASAVTAGVVVVVGQGGGQGDDVKIPPVKAVEEWTPYTLPGTPVAGLPLPVDYGRFHIVAPKTDPGPYAPAPSRPAGVKWVRADVKESATLDEFGENHLFIDPPYIPAGWVLTRVEARSAIWDDGSHTDGTFSLQYERPEYFPITIKRLLVAPDGRIRLVANPEADVTYTLGEIRGVPVVYDRDPLTIHFVQASLLTQIEAPLLHLDELIKIADALIAQIQGAPHEGCGGAQPA